MAEEIQEAVQIIRVAYDGIEIAMKVGSGGIAAMQKAIDGSSRIRAWISIQWQLLRPMVQAAWMLILFLRIR